MANPKYSFLQILIFLCVISTSYAQQQIPQSNTIVIDPILTIPTQQQPIKNEQTQQIQTGNIQTAQNQPPEVPPNANGQPAIASVSIEPTVVQPINAGQAGNIQNNMQTLPPIESLPQTNNNNLNSGTESNSQINKNPSTQQVQIPVENQEQANVHQAQNFDQPNAQRSARYRAEQQRLNQIRRRQQKQYEQREEIQRKKQQIKISKTQQVRNAERNQVRLTMTEDPIGVAKKTVLFEVDYKIHELVLYPVADVDIFLKMIVYVLDNNAYGVVKDVTSSGIVKVYVYEDSSLIAAEGSFYFEKALKFKGKAKSTYTIRFYNDGSNKLISLTYPNLLESSQIEDLYSYGQKNLHIWKTQILGMKIIEVTERLRRNAMMDKVNNQTMMDFLKKYSGYQFMEMLLVLAVTGFQVQLIKRMFKTDSIL